MQLLDDLSGLGVKDVLDIYARINQAKIDRGIAASNSQIAEWQAQGLLAMQQAQAYQPFAGTGLSNGALMIAALAVVAVGVVFAVKAN